MRVECEACHELVTASLAVDGATIRATCPACRHVMTTATAGDSPPAIPDDSAIDSAIDAASDADALCPKCSAPRKPGAQACGTCGLASARMAEYRDARDAAVAEPVRGAWQRACDAWADDPRHDELFQLAAMHNAYAWTAGRYRTRGRDPIAVRQLERLRRAAEATLLATATVRADASAKPYRATAGVLVTLVIVVAAGLLYAIVIRDRHHAAGPPALSGPASSSGGPGTIGPNGVRPLVPGHPVSSSTIK